MSVILDRGQGMETVSLEVLTGVDGQGAPAYDSPVDITVRAVREDTVVVLGSGSEVRSVATLWIPGTMTPMPGDQDRVTLADGLRGTVVELLKRKRLDGTLDHVRIKLREA